MAHNDALEATASPQDAFTLPQLAQAARISTDFLRAEIKAGRLRAVRLGVSLRVLPADWEGYLEAQPYGGPLECRDPRRRKASEAQVERSGDRGRGAGR